MSSTTSLLPAQLVDTTAYATLGYEDNALYNASSVGTQAELLTRIANQSHWVSSSTQRYDVQRPHQTRTVMATFCPTVVFLYYRVWLVWP